MSQAAEIRDFLAKAKEHLGSHEQHYHNCPCRLCRIDRIAYILGGKDWKTNPEILVANEG